MIPDSLRMGTLARLLQTGVDPGVNPQVPS